MLKLSNAGTRENIEVSTFFGFLFFLDGCSLSLLPSCNFPPMKRSKPDCRGGDSNMYNNGKENLDPFGSTVFSLERFSSINSSKARSQFSVELNIFVNINLPLVRL